MQQPVDVEVLASEDLPHEQWQARPVLAMLLRAVVFLIPPAASIITSMWLSRTLPPPENEMQLIGWWAVILTATGLVLIVFDRGVRRLAPLVLLLRASTVFPDQAPSRFRVALRSGASTKNLEEQIERARTMGADEISGAAPLILQLSTALEVHDRRTRGHAERVRAYCDMVADEMGLTALDRGKLRWGALLHDIGKLRIDPGILNKPDRLDEAEWASMREHPTEGLRLITPMAGWLGDWAGTVADHHERFDGTGYPKGTAGSAISLGGRIVSVADAYDVMTSVRAYSEPMKPVEARKELVSNSGSQFDPAVVRSFLSLSIGRLRWVSGPLAWLAQAPFLKIVTVVREVSQGVAVVAGAGAMSAVLVGTGVLTPTPAPAMAAPPDHPTVAERTIELYAGDSITERVLDPEANAVGYSVAVSGTAEFGTASTGNGAVQFSAGSDPGQGQVTVSIIDTTGTLVDDAAWTIMVLSLPDRVESLTMATEEDTPASITAPPDAYIVTQPLNGTASVSGGRIHYAPDADFHGSDPFEYGVGDDAARVVVTVSSAPDAPSARPGGGTVLTDAELTIDLLAGVTDVEDDIVTESVRLVDRPRLGSASVSAGELAYQAGSDPGVDRFSFEVCDLSGACSTAPIVIEVEQANRPPEPEPDELETLESASTTVDVLANDADPDGDELVITGVSTTALDGAVICTTNTCTYSPPAFAPWESGSIVDHFRYTVADPDGLEADAEVVVRITVVAAPTVPANSSPSARDDSATVLEGGSVVLEPLANDSDADGEAIELRSLTSPDHGVVSDLGDGRYRYTPDTDFAGTDGFSYTIADASGGLATGEVTISVTGINDSPSFVPGGDVAVLEDAGPIASTWATSVSAGPGETQSIVFDVASSNPSLFTSEPAIDRDGVLTFEAAPDAHGSATVTVQATDDGGTANGGVDVSDIATFTISVSSVNDAPVFDLAPDVVIEEDTGAVAVDFASGISPGPGDEAGQTVTFTVSSSRSDSLFSVPPAVSPTGVLTFTTASNANGSATVTIVARDDAGANSAPAISVITVTAVNDVPDFTSGGDVSVLEDHGPAVITWAGAISPGPTDEAGQSVTFTVEVSDPSLFSEQPRISRLGRLRFTPAPNANGPATTTVTAIDNEGAETSDTFALTITPVNDAPSLTPGGNLTISEDDGPQVAIWATGIDPGPADEAGQTVNLTIFSNNPGLFSAEPAIAQDGTVSYTAAPDASGVASVTVVASDDGGTANGGADSVASTFTITVQPVNDPPRFTGSGDIEVVEDSGPQSLTWATGIESGPADEAGQTVTFAAVANDLGLFSTQPAIDEAGTLTFTPANDATGSAVVTVTVMDDGGASVTTTFGLTVNAVNDAPSFTPGGAVAVDEDSGAQAVAWATAITAGPADESSQGLGFGVSASDPSLFSVQPAISTDGTLTFSPAADASGSAIITVVLTDDGGTGNGGGDQSPATTFDLVLDPVNDSPAFVSGGDIAVVEDSGPATIVGWASSISPGPADESGQITTFTVIATNPSLFSVPPVLDGASGDLFFIPAPDASGTATVTATIADDGGTDRGGTDTGPSATFTITVQDVNEAPIAADDPGLGSDPDDFLVVNTQELWISFDTLVANDSDPDGDPITLVPFGPSSTPNGSVSCVVDGCTYDPDASFAGTDTFTYVVTDGVVSASATVTITVADYVLSGLAGSLVINELNTVERSGEFDEAIEIYNGTGAPIDLTGFRIVDGNPIEDMEGTKPFDFIFPATDVLGAPSMLPAGGYAVVWVEDHGGENDAPGAHLQYENGHTQVLQDGGDDVWLLDPRDRIVDYVAYGDAGIINTPPPAGLGLWDATYQADLRFPTSSGRSLALAANGVDTNSSACFERTLTGDAGARPECAGAPVTVDTDPVPGRRTSLGASNTVSTNTSPTANDDGPLSGIEDAALFFDVDELLANDDDPDGDALVVGAIDAASTLGGTLGNLGGGSYRYDPPVDAVGTDTFTYTIHDGLGGFGTATVTVVLAAVNDDPSFAAGDDVVVTEDAGAQSIAWATGVSPGPTSESTQTVTFTTVVTSNPALFTIAPSIDETGRLTFTTAPDANGTAFLETTLADDAGGMASPATFAITATPENDAPVVNPIDPVTVPVGHETTFTAFASDADGDPLAYSLADGGGVAPSTAAIDPATGVFRWTPVGGDEGTWMFDVIVGDGVSAISTPVTIVVEAVRTRLAQSGGFSCRIEGGEAVCSGENDKGQLGDGTTTSRSIVAAVSGPDGTGTLGPVLDVGAGPEMACAVRTDGSVWCWGREDYDGRGGTHGFESLLPVEQTMATPAVEVAIGHDHVCVVHPDTTLSCWGGNNNGQLGDGTTDDAFTPVPVLLAGGPLTGVTGFTAMHHGTCALVDGGAWCWGDNTRGQLGNGTTTDSLIPVRVVGPGGIGSLEGVIDVSGSSEHACAVVADGTVWCWGRNDAGQLGDGTTTDSQIPVQVVGPGGTGTLDGVTEVAAAKRHTCALGPGGAVSCWGEDLEGQLGNGDPLVALSVPSQVVDDAGDPIAGVVRLFEDGGSSLYACGSTATGSVQCWGANANGQFGDGTTTTTSSAVEIL